jgi:hypothetical protein
MTLYFYFALIIFQIKITAIVCFSNINSWNGRSGDWESSHMWSDGIIPSKDSHVIINLAESDTIYVHQDILIYNLTLTGGTIELHNNTVLNISNSFVFYGGHINSADKSEATVISNGRSKLLGTRQKHLRSITFIQNNNELLWRNGNIVLSNATISITCNASF